MACSREPTSRMYAALENGSVVQVLAMVLAGGLRRATHGFEHIKCTAKRESAQSLSSELERSQSPSDLVVAGFKVVGGHHPTTLPLAAAWESPEAAKLADSSTIYSRDDHHPAFEFLCL